MKNLNIAARFLLHCALNKNSTRMLRNIRTDRNKKTTECQITLSPPTAESSPDPHFFFFVFGRLLVVASTYFEKKKIEHATRSDPTSLTLQLMHRRFQGFELDFGPDDVDQPHDFHSLILMTYHFFLYAQVRVVCMS